MSSNVSEVAFERRTHSKQGQNTGSLNISSLKMQARRLHKTVPKGGTTMELHELNADAVLELQQMLDTPIEDQAASYELSMLGIVLGNAINALKSSDSDEETCEVLSHMLKSAFVIGRRHVNRLI